MLQSLAQLNPSLSLLDVLDLSIVKDSIGSMAPDEPYLDALAKLPSTSVPHAYMAPVSPRLFTHYPVDSYNKNVVSHLPSVSTLALILFQFAYLSDEHLYVQRWESLIRARDRVDIVQALTWNDYGESHYLGPIKGAQPNSQAWVDGFDHSGMCVLLL
jgi:glucan endo-1,3-alpha-glucosidase